MTRRADGPTGHIEKRGDAWRVVVEAGRDPTTGTRRRIVRSGITGYHNARRIMRHLLTELDEQTYIHPSQVTVSDYLRGWLTGHAMVAAENTLEIYAIQVQAYVSPHIGHLPMQQLAPTDLDGLYTKLLQHGRRDGSGLALKTVRNVHVMLHRALEDAVATDLIKRNPASRAKPPTSRKARKPAAHRPTWTRQEAERFLAFVETDRLRALFLLALTTGLRRSEILGLPWDHVNLKEGHLAVVQALVEIDHQPKLKPLPKTDHSRRRLALDSVTIRTMQDHRRLQTEERFLYGDSYTNAGLAFTREDGSPLHPTWVSRRFTQLARAAQLPDLSPRPFHGLRHTYGTLALEAGVPIEVVSKRLGHASIAITADIYQHLRPDTDRHAAETIADFLFNPCRVTAPS